MTEPHTITPRGIRVLYTKRYMRLSEGLKKRYDEQYPLVRSLADVFVSNVSAVSLCIPCVDLVYAYLDPRADFFLPIYLFGKRET